MTLVARGFSPASERVGVAARDSPRIKQPASLNRPRGSLLHARRLRNPNELRANRRKRNHRRRAAPLAFRHGRAPRLPVHRHLDSIAARESCGAAGCRASPPLPPDLAIRTGSGQLHRVWQFHLEPHAGLLGLAGRPSREGQCAPRRRSIMARDGRERLLVPGGEWTRTRPRWSSDAPPARRCRRRGSGTRGRRVLRRSWRGTTADRVRRSSQLVPIRTGKRWKRLLGGCPFGSPRRVGTCILDVRTALRLEHESGS